MALSSSSTTETTTYILEKYSRAYSPKKASGSSEWQHFTNPVLRLILDSKIAPENQNRDAMEEASSGPSMRLRIVWTMNGGGAAASGAAQDVVLVCLFALEQPARVLLPQDRHGGQRLAAQGRLPRYDVWPAIPLRARVDRVAESQYCV
ncbi:hypothetical protein C8F04DRAFT_1132140 [Mycena alexandri]|uniref:Uncharacterized protein n=1 Tax=Mycena alexandri TaxID=1745969 RepID=A0AAD6WT31_9AGAR|nr:hypothetical protein C8F04DRAFT_1132140 [Mycena alexandri]